MPRLHPIFALIAISMTAPAAAQTAAPADIAAPELRGIDRTTQTEDVRFRSDAYQRMTVGVTVGGKGPYRFVVDTGADRTVVSSDLAAHSRLAPAGYVPLHSIAGVTSVATAKVPTLQVTSKPVRNVIAPVLSGRNIGADGILGVDSLRSQRIVLDFKTETMSVVPSRADLPDDPDAIVVEGYRRNGRLVITEASIHGMPVTVVVDTGSEATIGNPALQSALLSRSRLAAPQRVELQSVTGQTLTGDSGLVDRLAIGGVVLGNVDVVFASSHIFDQLRLQRRPALLLGMNALRAFKKVTIDFAAQKLRVVVPEHSFREIQFARL